MNLSNRRKAWFLVFLLTGIFCSAQTANKFPETRIHIGKTNISGKVVGFKDVSKLRFGVAIANLFCDEQVPTQYETPVLSDGTFNIDIPLELERGILRVVLSDDSLQYHDAMVGVDQQKPMRIDFNKEEDGISMKVSGGMGFSSIDAQEMMEAIFRFEDAPIYDKNRFFERYKLPLADFLKAQIDTVLPQRIEYALSNLDFSPAMKQMLTQSFKRRYASGRLLSYKEDTEKFLQISAEEPPLSYYSFLKDLDLQSSNILYDICSSKFLQYFLEIKPFNIPKIDNTPVREWQEIVINNVKNTVGFSSGIFYDLLPAMAYASQIENKKRPLTEAQIKNINAYFTGDKADIKILLLRRNENLVNLLNQNRNLNIQPTPNVPKEQLMEAILKKYPNKAVVIDFWATWCGPCMMAHKEMNAVKPAQNKDNIVFVYITTSSSPKALWEDKIKTIGGEQYYITEDEWNYLLDSNKFDGVPAYLIFDKAHELKHLHVGFPGTEQMEKWIQEAQ